MSFQKRFQLVAIAILAAVVVISLGRGAAGAEAQDVNSLDRRISMLEQRFYSLESSMNRLQQAITSQRSTGSASSDVRDREVDQLQGEVQRLQLRLNEVECGLLKLDERTATASGNRRTGDARPADPCRQNPSAPLRLQSRP
jgi:predicted RNase H-like nuclease (RuvC/YqgF family)